MTLYMRYVSSGIIFIQDKCESANGIIHWTEDVQWLLLLVTILSTLYVPIWYYTGRRYVMSDTVCRYRLTDIIDGILMTLFPQWPTFNDRAIRPVFTFWRPACWAGEGLKAIRTGLSGHYCCGYLLEDPSIMYSAAGSTGAVTLTSEAISCADQAVCLETDDCWSSGMCWYGEASSPWSDGGQCCANWNTNMKPSACRNDWAGRCGRPATVYSVPVCRPDHWPGVPCWYYIIPTICALKITGQAVLLFSVIIPWPDDLISEYGPSLLWLTSCYNHWWRIYCSVMWWTWALLYYVIWRNRLNVYIPGWEKKTGIRWTIQTAFHQNSHSFALFSWPSWLGHITDWWWPALQFYTGAPTVLTFGWLLVDSTMGTLTTLPSVVRHSIRCYGDLCIVTSVPYSVLPLFCGQRKATT